MTDDEIKQAMQWASINTLRFPIHAMLSELLELRKKKQWPSEDEFEDLILTWQRAWMDVKGTDERDRKSYFNRAAGIDANMRYGLAKKIREYLSQYTPPKETQE